MYFAIRPFLALCRVSNLPTVWTNVLCAIVLADSLTTPSLLLLTMSMSLFYTAGMCLNDVCDVAIDRVKRSSRPLPSSRISMRSAWTLTVLLFAAAFAPLCFVPYPRAIWAGIILLATVVCYDKFHKRHAFSVLIMGSCRWLVFAISALAVSGTIAPAVHIAAFSQWVYVVLLSLVARWENRHATRFSYPVVKLPRVSVISLSLERLPVVPWLITCISLLDGLIMAIFVSPVWLLPGIVGMLLTRAGQKYVRGD